MIYDVLFSKKHAKQMRLEERKLSGGPLEVSVCFCILFLAAAYSFFSLPL